MKKLLTILSTAPLALAACGAQPLDDIDMVEIGEASPIPSYSALSYGTTGGERVYDGTYSFGNTQSYLRKEDTWWYNYNQPNQNDKCEVRQDVTADRMVMLSAIFNDEKANMKDDSYLIDYNGYNFVFSTAPAVTWTESGTDTHCYAEGGTMTVITSASTMVRTNLTKTVANLDKDLKVISVSLDETNQSNGQYVWEDQYVSGTTNSYGHKVMDVNEFNDAIINSSIPVTWRDNVNNTDTVWKQTMAAISLKFKGLTLAEAEAVTLGTGWIPEGITGADENFLNRAHYANLIVDAIRNATAQANA